MRRAARRPGRARGRERVAGVPASSRRSTSPRCVNCLLCWLYCPDSAVRLDGTTFTGFDLDLCKGCEICAEVCPVDAMKMVPEGDEAMIDRARLMTGGEAVAEAMRQIDPDVVPVYPITPQTPIIQGFAKFVADGRAHAESSMSSPSTRP